MKICPHDATPLLTQKTLDIFISAVTPAARNEVMLLLFVNPTSEPDMMEKLSTAVAASVVCDKGSANDKYGSESPAW